MKHYQYSPHFCRCSPVGCSPFSLWPLLVRVCLALLFQSMAVGGGVGEQGGGFTKQASHGFQHLNGNQINATVGADGPFIDYREWGQSGLEWPKGSGMTAVYSAGLWIAGRHVPSDSLRVATMFFASEYQPGPLLEIFNTSLNDDSGPVVRATDSTYRAYKIQKNDTTSQDYVEWPGRLGAPYHDVNGNGGWDAGIDRPTFRGDQQIWSVINDVSRVRHASIGTTLPMGLEVQSLYYCLDYPTTLDNAMFMEWMIINRSDADYDSVCIGIWSDPELGYPLDDLPGSDSLLGLGFFYNASDSDSQYGDCPPAAGFVLLAGPVVPGGAGDSALVEGQWIPGCRNLPLACAVGIAKHTPPEITGPSMQDSSYAQIVYNILRGRAGQTGGRIRRPDSSLYPLYWFSGDPVTGQGDLPANFPLGEFRPQDIRMLEGMGPFDLASGDTQYVAAAFVIAQGSDHLNSVAALKTRVAIVKDLYLHGTVAGVGENVGAIPVRFSLRQNWPNPFNPRTNIGFGVWGLGSRWVRLAVYDVLGREVAVLVDEVKGPGTYEVQWDASKFTSGMYICRLNAGSQIESKKMLLLK